MGITALEFETRKCVVQQAFGNDGEEDFAKRSEQMEQELHDVTNESDGSYPQLSLHVNDIRERSMSVCMCWLISI